MTDVLDAIVVGAGPSGCVTAAALARHGRKVLLLDRDPEPRFKIGESLLPWNMPIFARVGVLPKIEAHGFQPKYGAMFWNERTGGKREVIFRDAWDSRHPSAFQVKRAEFDALLARHAAECGAGVRRGVRVIEPVFEGERAVGVRAEAGGGTEEIRARCVVDATGQAALIASRLKMRKGDPNLKRAAFYAHYEGAWRDEGERAGDILLPFVSDVWYWVIPFSDGSASVGAVFEPSLVKGRTEPREVLFEELLARSKKMPKFLENAKRTTGVFTTADYSITADRFSGDGWVLVGDSATFLDPVFSTGVYLGTCAGERAANVIHGSLSRKGRVDGGDFREYEKVTRAMVRRLTPFVYGYYDPVFTREFCCDKPTEFMRKAVTSTLAGDVEKPGVRVRLSSWLTVTLIEMAKRSERAAALKRLANGQPA
jgi:flavin-dependent dehydrogenase